MANYTVGWGVWAETNKADGTELCPNKKGLVTFCLPLLQVGIHLFEFMWAKYMLVFVVHFHHTA